jgi:hypothetical protein
LQNGFRHLRSFLWAAHSHRKAYNRASRREQGHGDGNGPARDARSAAAGQRALLR